MSNPNAVASAASSNIVPLNTVDLSAGTPPSSSDTVSLPDPVMSLAVCGDPGTELAMLCIKSGDEQRQAARTERDALEASQEYAENQEVQAMRDKAGAVLAQGIAEGVGQCTQGVLTGFAAGAAMNTPAGANPPPGQFLGFTELGWKGGAFCAQGAGQIIGAIYAAHGANDDADAAQAHAAAGHFANLVQDEHDNMQAATGFVQSAIDFYREYQSTQAQIRNAAVHVA